MVDLPPGAVISIRQAGNHRFWGPTYESAVYVPQFNKAHTDYTYRLYHGPKPFWRSRQCGQGTKAYKAFEAEIIALCEEKGLKYKADARHHTPAPTNDPIVRQLREQALANLVKARICKEGTLPSIDYHARYLIALLEDEE